jgi:Cytochrome c7 and related cytochrome c
MSGPFRDREHLLRVAGLFGAGILVFLGVQAALVPRGFGQYGHFRPAALGDNQKRPLVYAGRSACQECHSDVGDTLKGGKHASLGCEACHGPLAGHADDASVHAATRPDGRLVCLVCHTQNVAKPKGFPQVDPREHAPEGSCLECHKTPHSPSIS